jgi:multiple sugar transport system substrate-binding protein
MKKRKISRAGMVLLILFVSGFFTSAQGLSAEKVTLSFWKHSHGPADVFTKELITKFEKENPNIKIELLVTPWDQHLQKLMVSMAGGIGPDLFDLRDPDVPFYAGKGLLAPIDPQAFGFQTQADLEKEWLPNSFATVAEKGVIYGVPFEGNSWSLYINDVHFKEIGLDPAKDYPKTWEDVGKIGAKLVKYDANNRMTRAGFTFPLKLGTGWYLLTWCPIFYQLGGSILNETNDKALVNSPAGVKALQIWSDMIYKYKTATVDFGIYTDKDPNLDFAQGNLSMWMIGAWARPTLEGNKEVYNNYRVVPLPRIAAGSPRVVCTNAIPWHVSSQSKNKRAAWEFVNFASKHQEDWLKRAGYIVTRKGWFNTPTAKSFPYLDVFLDDMSHGRPRMQSVYFNEIGDSLKRAIQRTMFNKVPPQQSLDTAAQEIEKAIKK